VRLPLGAASVVKAVSVIVRNADTLPLPEQPGHEIRVVADAGDCPGSILAGVVDVPPRPRFGQDGALVSGGQKRRDTVLLHVDRDQFHSPSRATPHRCTLRFTAVGPGDDPTAANNLAELTVEVRDANDY
jgi:hypothetical protein